MQLDGAQSLIGARWQDMNPVDYSAHDQRIMEPAAKGGPKGRSSNHPSTTYNSWKISTNHRKRRIGSFGPEIKKKREKNSSATHASLGRQRIDTLAQDDAAILTIHYPVSRIIAAHASFRPICNRAVGLPLFSLAASQDFNHLVNLIRRLLIIRSSFFFEPVITSDFDRL